MNRTCHAWAFVAALLLGGCVAAPAGERHPDEARIDPVAATTTGLEALPPTPRPFPNRPIELGQGDCAPRVGDRIVGTCIANRPCRGYGERDDNGTLQCACFGLRGGCAAPERCDLVKKTCVPLGEPPFGRTPAP